MRHQTLYTTLLVVALLIILPTILAVTEPTARLAVSNTHEATTVTLRGIGIPDNIPIIITLTTTQGGFYILPAQKTSIDQWQTTFPVTGATTISAQQGLNTLATISLEGNILPPEETTTPKEKKQFITTINLQDSKQNYQEALITIQDSSGSQLQVTTDLAVELVQDYYTVTIEPTQEDIQAVTLKQLYIDETITLGLETIKRKETIHTITTNNLNYYEATITLEATANTLYRCNQWDFTKQQCQEKWTLDKKGLTTGKNYTTQLTTTSEAFKFVNEKHHIKTPKGKSLVTKTKIKGSNNEEHKANITIKDKEGTTLNANTDLAIELIADTYEVIVEPKQKNLAVNNITFHDLYIDKNIELGLEPLQLPQYKKSYAIDPTQLNFTNATVTATATGTTLYKCADWNFTTQTCYGNWEQYKENLVPGETYTFTLTPKDPAFGESDDEGTADSCTFSDDTGQGDGDTNVNCLTEITTQDSGYTADMDDHENVGATATMDISFTNSLLVDTINEVNITVTYQRQTDANVGPTTATIQVVDTGTYTTACTDTVTIGSWETYTCDLSTWVTTETELNNVDIRLITDTEKSGGPKDAGTTYIDHVYLSADYVERDVTPPQYSNIITSPTSPQTYATRNYWFNSTWTDNFDVDTVNLEHNFTGIVQNTTLDNVSTTYYYNTALSAGSYTWKIYANDTSGNTNNTSIQTYTVNKATPTLTLTLNDTSNNSTINNSGSLNIQGTGGEGTLEILREQNVIASSTSPVSTSELFNTVGEHNITLRHNETDNYMYNNISYTVTVQDTIPPGLVTSLANISHDDTWITWTWTNPVDADFDHVEVWLNGIFKTNTTSTTYNATSLSADTMYELQLRTVDTHNVKSIYVNDTGRTKISLDTTSPIITDLTTTNITPTSANISWQTNELAGCEINWGTTTGIYTESTTCLENALAQTIILTNLQPETDYYYRITAIDVASNNVTSPERSFTTLQDATAPTWSNAITQPLTPTTYDPTRTYWFNVTWTDDVTITSAVIEHNFSGSLQNITMNNVSNTYYYNTTLDAGSYVWRSYATDGVNTNKTTRYSYQVNKATPTTALYLDGIENNNTINEDSTATINATMITPTNGYLYLYYDKTLIAQGNDYVEYTTTHDIPGMYNITLFYEGNTNYEAQTTTYWLTVDDTTAPNVTLTSPAIGHNDSDGIVVFNYDVQDDGGVSNCSLLINGTIEQTNISITLGQNSFTKEDFSNGLYNWNIECYDTANNKGNDTARSLIIDKQTITTHIPVTSVGVWADTTPITLSDINETDTVTHTYTIPKGTQQYITWTNYTTANVPPGATLVDADFNAYHLGNTKTTFEGIEWYDGSIYAGTGCLPVTQNGVYQTNSCDLSNYIDTVDEANNISLRYLVSAANTGSGGSITIDELYMTIVYIKETTPPEFSNIYNVTLDIGESLSAQYNATDNYGISHWSVNNTNFAITNNGLLINTSTLVEGTYPLLITVYDQSNNSAEQNVTIFVKDIIDLHISLDTTGLGPQIAIYNSTGGLLSSASTELTDSFLAGQLYDLVITTTLTSGEQKATLYNVNLTQNLNITSTGTETYTGSLPDYITSISPLFAINDSALNYDHAQLSLPKAGLPIEYISHCTAWDFATNNCNAWEVNETTNYDYAENETHFTINVTSFDAFGGGPGDTLPNITAMKLYDVTYATNKRTQGTLVGSGLSTDYNIRSDREYRAEFNITNAGKKWVIANTDITTHTGLNTSWTVNTTNDIWYSIAGTNYTGGTFSSGVLGWDLSQGGTLDQTESGTWYYIFNVTTLPEKDYNINFLINDTNKNSGSTDTSTYKHIYVKELLVNESSLQASSVTPLEGAQVEINMTIYNVGIENATNFTVELWDLTTTTLLYTNNITISATNKTTLHYNWTALTGIHDLELRADTTNNQAESFENNNNYSTTITVSVWQILYGHVFNQEVLGSDTNNFYEWPIQNTTNANLYAVDADTIINWNNLQALTRDVNNNSATNDLAEADIALNLLYHENNITTKYGIDESTPKETTTYTVYEKTIHNVPVIDSTTTNSFQTGIFWDTTTDGNGEYDGSEPLIFTTKVNPNAVGTYGNYDYELRVPSTLQQTAGSTDETYFYMELT